ncbi:MAG: hypothetical protein EZS28_033697, partial [Streblomastix strix]
LQLKLREVSDNEKEKQLESLIILAMSFDSQDWRGIILESGIIEIASQLLGENENPRIRTLCGTILMIMEQRGSEVGQLNDYRSLLSPLVSLLFLEYLHLLLFLYINNNRQSLNLRRIGQIGPPGSNEYKGGVKQQISHMTNSNNKPLIKPQNAFPGKRVENKETDNSPVHARSHVLWNLN